MMTINKSAVFVAVLFCGAASAQEPTIDLSKLPQGYTVESTGSYGAVTERFLYAENDVYVFEKIYSGIGDQRYVRIIRRNVSGQTLIIEPPKVGPYYYFPHDCFAQIDLCAFSFLDTPVETRPNRKGFNNYTYVDRGVWVEDHFSAHQNGLKLNRNCYTLDEFGLRLDWMSFEFDISTYNYTLLVDWEARAVPAQPDDTDSRLAQLRNTCLFAAAVS